MPITSSLTPTGRLSSRAGIGTSQSLTGVVQATSLTSGTNTYGAWVQLIASTAADYYITSLIFANDNYNANNYGYYIQLGTGAAASEFIIAEVALANPFTSYVGGPVTPLPSAVRVPTGTRVAARYAVVGPSAGATGRLLVNVAHVNSLEA